MTAQQFSKYLSDPGLVNDQSLTMFEELVIRFPYCQSAQLMLAFNQYAEESSHFTTQLRKAAAYAGDRSLLRELVGYARSVQVMPRRKPEPEPDPAEPSAPLLQAVRETEWVVDPEIREPLPYVGELPLYEPLTPAELITIVKNRLLEIEAEKYQEGTDSEGVNRSGKTSGGNKAALIDKFIQDEPRISKPGSTFFNPSDSALRSNFDEEEIVSETLAQLYAQQGNIQKAIHIYEKLSLLNQEKSRFFAAQIQKLNS